MAGFIWLWLGVLCQTVSTDASSGMEYVLFTFHQPWNTARKVCRGHGGHLAILDTVEQLTRVRNLSEGVWGYENGYRWVGLQVNQSVLLWEGTCAEQDLSNASLALFENVESPKFTGGQCFILPPKQHVLYDHRCDHSHPFICELQAPDGVSINTQNTTAYMEEGDDSKTPHKCEPAALDGQTTTEMDQTTQVTSVPTDGTSSPANDNYSGPIETSSSANDNSAGADDTTSPANHNFVGSDENTSPANDHHVDADETSSPVIVNYSSEVTSIPSDESSSPANDHYVDTDEISSPVIVNYSSVVTSIPSDETSSPANDHYVDTDETSSPANVTNSGEDKTSSPANDNSVTTGSIVDSADNTPRATENQVCREYNIPVMSVEELSAVLAAIAKELAVDKKNLSSRVRKKVSAQDNRPSAAKIGYVAVFIITIPVFVVLVLDIPRAVQQIKCVFFTIKTKGRPTRTAQLV